MLSRKSQGTLILLLAITGVLGFGLFKNYDSKPKVVGFDSGIYDGNIGTIDSVIEEASRFRSNQEMAEAISNLQGLKQELEAQKQKGVDPETINQQFFSKQEKTVKHAVALTYKYSIPDGIKCYNAKQPDKSKQVIFAQYLQTKADIELKLAALDKLTPEIEKEVVQINNLVTDETRCGF